MGEWIKKNPVVFALINLALCILLASAVLKVYVDYKVNKEVVEMKKQLDKIEESTDIIVNFIK